METNITHKYIDRFRVIENRHLSPIYSLLILSPCSLSLSDINIQPGQFMQIEIPNGQTFLRRPISICNVEPESNRLWILVRNAGKGTSTLINLVQGDTVNIIFPLGHGFTLSGFDHNTSHKALLVGGGVGVAPLLYLGSMLAKSGIQPHFLIGGRSKTDLLLREYFESFGPTYVTTDDGSEGHHGLVTGHQILSSDFDMIYCCGPMPMMKAIATIANQREIPCEISLENTMGCGIGACLCCVEKTKDEGNVCVCTDGPVFNIKRLNF